MRILYITTIGSTMGFFKDFIRELLDEGHTVDIATNENEAKVHDYYREWGCGVHQIDCSRAPLRKENLYAIKQINEIVNGNKYDIVHCHTPIAASCARLACKGLRKKGVKVIYTAHGFHFYKGAPLKNWLIYYPVEKMCAHWTDALITINREDYALAQKKMKAKKIYYVPGVGIDTERFRDAVVDKKAKRAELGVPQDAVLLLSVGELNENKNHETVIKALAQIKRKDVHYAIAGQGELENYLKKVATNFDVDKQVHLVGYRTDVAELYKAADICCFPSIREGLSVALMEAMASELPCVVSNIRGNTDLIQPEKGGYLLEPCDVSGFAHALARLVENVSLRQQMGAFNSKIVEKFDMLYVKNEMQKIYQWRC